MGFRNIGKTQLKKYSANFNWEGAVKAPYKVWLIPCQRNHVCYQKYVNQISLNHTIL